MAEDPNDQGKGPNWRQLEQSRDNALSQAQAWKQVALQGLVKSGGFDPKDPIVGLLVDQFNTDELDPEKLDADAFAKFAKTYNVEPKVENPATPPGQPNPDVAAQVQQMQAQQGQPGQPAQPGQPPATPPAQPQPVPAQGFMQNFQQPADVLLNSSAANPATQPTTLQQQAAAAEAAGDWGAAFNSKFAMTRQAFNASPQPAQHAGPVNDQGLPVHSPGAA